MVKMFHYMKERWHYIVLIIVLLFVQAFCDLSLPDYTSKIVNVGIQQKGIEDCVPETIQEVSMNELFLFMDEDDRAQVERTYDLADGMYTLEDISEDERTALNNIFGVPMMAVTGLTSEDDSSKEMQKKITDQMQLPEGTDILPVFAQMPEDVRMKMMDEMTAEISQMPESIVTQSAILYVQNEYSAQGIDLDSMQMRYVLFSGLKMLGLALLGVLAAIGVTFLASQVASTLGRNLRNSIYRKVLTFSGSELNHFSAASLITRSTNDIQQKSTHNRRERPVHGHRGGSRGRFYYRITTFEGRPWDARDPYKTTFMALKHEIRLSIWRKQKETPGVEKAPGVSSPQRKESGRSGRDDGELRFWVRPGHPYKAVTSISQAEALAHGLTHLHHLVFAAVLARELDWCAALQDAREDARPWGVVGIGLRSDVWVEVRRDDHRPAVLVT